MTVISRTMHETFLDELVALTRQERNDLAIQLLELSALHIEGEITDGEFELRKRALIA